MERFFDFIVSIIYSAVGWILGLSVIAMIVIVALFGLADFSLDGIWKYLLFVVGIIVFFEVFSNEKEKEKSEELSKQKENEQMLDFERKKQAEIRRFLEENREEKPVKYVIIK